MEQIGVNVEEYANELAKLNEDVVSGLPEDLVEQPLMSAAVIMFRHLQESVAGHEPIAQTLLSIDNYSGFYLEFDTERAGDFKPLRFLKDNQQVVLCLFSSKFGELENKEDILKRIEDVHNMLIGIESA